MSEISELEEKLRQSQKKLNDLQYEVNAIHMELMKLKDEENGAPVMSASQAAQLEQRTVQQGAVSQPVQQKPVQPQGSPYRQQTTGPQGSPYRQQTTSQQGTPNKQGQPAQTQQDQLVPGQSGQIQAGAQGRFVRPQAQSMQYSGGHTPVQGYAPQQPKKPKKPDAEIMMGIRGMGIVASILVFISFILFAMYLIPGLTEEIKMALMFIVSIAMTTVGLIFWFKKKESLFFLSLGACGVGALYISLFVSNIYFHMIDQIPLYVLLLLWAAGVLYLSRIKPLLFEIIGLVGIVISVFFGTISCCEKTDGIMLGILAIYLVVGCLAFMILKMKSDVSLFISNIATWIGSFIIVIGCYFVIYDTAFPASVLVVLALILIVFNLVMINQKTYHTLPFFGAGYSIVLLMALRSVISASDFIKGLTLIVCIMLYVGVEIYYKQELIDRAPVGARKSVGIISWQILLLVISLYCVVMHETLNETVGVFMLIIPLLVYGFIKDDKQSKISSLILYWILAIEISMNPVVGLIYVIAVFGLAVVLMYVNKNQYSTAFKVVIYSTFMVGLHVWILYMAVENEWDGYVTTTLLMFIAGVINLAAFKSPFGKNWLTWEEEQGITIATSVINALLMFESLVLMYNVDEDWLHVFVVMIAIMLFVINSVRLLKSDSTPAVVYVGVKFTVLLICILHSFNVVNYVISISVFALAICFILLGFKLKVKSLRIYGLVTTMIFAVKLIMIDIKYDNVLGNAVSFFISGLMCFGISALYSIADKKLSKGEDDQKKKDKHNEYNYDYQSANQMNAQMINSVNNQINNQMTNQINDQVSDQMNNQMNAQVNNQLNNQSD